MQFRKLIKGEFIVLNISSNCYDIYESINLGNKSSMRHLFDPLASKPYYTGYNWTNKPAIHPDGTKLYFPNGSEAPWMKILDLTTGLILTNPASPPTVRINSIEISPEANEICLSASASPFLYRYSLPDLTLKAAPAVLPPAASNNAAYSPNGQWVALGCGTSPYVTVYNRSDMSKITVPAAYSIVQALVFSPDNQYLAVAGQSAGAYTVSLYRTSNWTKITTSIQPNFTVYTLAFSPDSTKLAAGYGTSGNNMIAYLNVNTPTGAWTTIVLPPPYNTANTVSTPMSCKWLDNDIIVFIAPGAGSNYRMASAMAFTYNFTTAILLDAYPITGIGVGLAGLEWYNPVIRKLTGTVKDISNASLARTVRAYDKYSGEIVGETTSSASNSTFTMYLYTSDPVIVMSIGQGTEITELFDSVTPVV